MNDSVLTMIMMSFTLFIMIAGASITILSKKELFLWFIFIVVVIFGAFPIYEIWGTEAVLGLFIGQGAFIITRILVGFFREAKA